MLTFSELLEIKTLVGIDDVHAAHAIVSETQNMYKEVRMFRIAEILATLREHYVKIGRELERERLDSLPRDPEQNMD